MAGEFTLYDYSYTGSSTWVDEGSGNWHINFTSGGTLTLLKSVKLDLYLLGGGQCGLDGNSDHWGDEYLYYGGKGGQGGYTNKPVGVVLAPGSYTVTIGQGGTGGNGQAGGTTSIGSYSAPGGGSGSSASGTVVAGANGGDGYGNTTPSHMNGYDATILDFEGYNRGGGGGGGQRAVYNSSSGNWSYSGYGYPAKGGQLGGGGGDGGSTTYYPATANYGGGGGGRNTSSSSNAGQAGSSGYAQMRNAR